MSRAELNPFERLLVGVEEGLRSVFGQPRVTERDDPSAAIEEADMSDEERKHAAGLMRVNHAGEVSAQGLYQGQALTARMPEVRTSMERASREEYDHLEWCRNRVRELDSHTSVLDPFWYAGSFAIGATAGLVGDKWSLGFVAETEHQVVRHLDSHLVSLPEKDARSRAIVEQMKEDELHHATTALNAGGASLPFPVKKMMGLMSRVMTTTAYRV